MVKFIKEPLQKQEYMQKLTVSSNVSEILDSIRKEGDSALFKLNKAFDNYESDRVLVSQKQLKHAYTVAGDSVIESLTKAANNIRQFSLLQRSMLKDMEMEVTDGVTVGHTIIPVEACGCYVPGGRYPLPSSALMSIIPAKAAGVKRVAACSPKSPGHDTIHPAVLVAMDIAGADEIYCMGGAQAIGAFAYGTKSVNSVNLIVGPGNQYVTEAKKQVYGTVNIDFLAGPSEVLIIADDSANTSFIAADILAQSEHDPQASGILITTSKRVALGVSEQIDSYLNDLDTKETAEVAWKNNGRILLCDTLNEAAELAEGIAPEHLELQVTEPEPLRKILRNYGSLFIGGYAAEVFGDYSSGTNHILPTVKAAKYTGGLWSGTFLKVVTYQKVTKEGAKQIGTAASQLAGIEGLTAHKLAADLRLQ